MTHCLISFALIAPMVFPGRKGRTFFRLIKLYVAIVLNTKKNLLNIEKMVFAQILPEKSEAFVYQE